MTDDDKNLIEDLRVASYLWANQKGEYFLETLHDSYKEFARRIAQQPVSDELLNAAVERLPKFLLGMKEAKSYLYVMVSKSILETFMLHGKLEYFLKQPQAEEALEWFCCDHSCAYLQSNNNGYIPMFQAFLSKWTGVMFPVNVTPSLDKVVEFLYSKAAWGLYGANLESRSDDETRGVVYDVTTANLPLRFRFESSIGNSGPVQLPTI